jgi:NAD+ diphosphatase
MKEINKLYFLFSDNKIILLNKNDKLSLPTDADFTIENIEENSQITFSNYKNISCIAAGIKNFKPVNKLTLFEIRSIYEKVDIDIFNLILKAAHFFYWNDTSKFCGRCGSKTIFDEKLRAKKCTSCDNIIFPRISPAVIVGIEKGDKLLLAQGLLHKFHSILAGFVEVGETLEETVKREVFEEAGIKIKNIKYFGSQPWPFPDSLMIGFTAEYESGELNIDKNELTSAGWFSIKEFPNVPGKLSIAGNIIENFINKNK